MIKQVSTILLSASFVLCMTFNLACANNDVQDWHPNDDHSDLAFLSAPDPCPAVQRGQASCGPCSSQKQSGFPLKIGRHGVTVGSLTIGMKANQPQTARVTQSVYVPSGPAPQGFVESFFATQPRQPHAVYHQPAFAVGPQAVYQQPTFVAGQQTGFIQGQGHSVSHPESVNERIVYVPYAMPPPIHVERLGKALPRPKLRRLLGDATMHEYPEMPIEMYTTRGPRDFLATDPPGIGY